jgi:hypothetical protein
MIKFDRKHYLGPIGLVVNGPPASSGANRPTSYRGGRQKFLQCVYCAVTLLKDERLYGGAVAQAVLAYPGPINLSLAAAQVGGLGLCRHGTQQFLPSCPMVELRSNALIGHGRLLFL